MSVKKVDPCLARQRANRRLKRFQRAQPTPKDALIDLAVQNPEHRMRFHIYRRKKTTNDSQ